MADNVELGDRQRGKRWRITTWSGSVLILLLPLVAMQFTDEVNWTLSDFVFAGILLFGSLGAYEVAARKTGNFFYRAGAGVGIAAIFLLIWLNGAVGIIGSERDPVNLVYYAVLAVVVSGAFVARLRPRGMARAMAATAIALALVAVIVLVGGFGSPKGGALEVVAVNGFFIAFFAGSAWLFRQATVNGSG